MLAPLPSLGADPGDSVAGRYRLTGVQDAASELELTADGRFRYYLAYGALDEMAEGVWRREGSQVLLTTQPQPVPPLFLLKNATRREGEGLFVNIIGPDGEGIAGIDVLVRLDDGSRADGYTQEDGLQLDLPEGRRAETVSLSIPIYRVQSPDFPLNLARANALEFLLEPNDLGEADFRDLPLEPADSYVEMLRDGTRLRYERVR